jgi:hypothetical protein
MAKFIEIEDATCEKHLLNVEHIFDVEKTNDVTTLYLTPKGYHDCPVQIFMTKMSYEDVCKLIKNGEKK